MSAFYFTFYKGFRKPESSWSALRLVLFLVSVLVPVSQNLNFLGLFRYPFWSYLDLAGFLCDKSVSWYLGYQTFLEENVDIFK